MLKRSPSEQLFIATITGNRRSFKPSKGDIESGVVATLGKEGIHLPFAHGKHRWIRHENPPSPHHPEGSVVLWADWQQGNSSSRIQPWNGDTSWLAMMRDTHFCKQTDAYLEQLLQKNPGLRAYHFLGFPTEQQTRAVKEKKLQGIVSEYGAQSQSRAHIHIAQTIHPNDPWVSTVPIHQLANTLVLQKLFNIAANKSMHEFQRELNGFGSVVEYTQTVGVQGILVPRKFFEFRSWQEALKSIFDLKRDIAAHWLDHAYAVCSQSEQFLGHALSMYQTLSCIPVFALIRPSKNDQKQLKRPTRWLVIPFSLEIPSSMFGPGVVLNRNG